MVLTATHWKATSKAKSFRPSAKPRWCCFVVDIREGITPLDKQIALLLRKHNLPVLLVANKADSPKLPLAGEFVRLGFGGPICISAANLINRAQLLEYTSRTPLSICQKNPSRP